MPLGGGLLGPALPPALGGGNSGVRGAALGVRVGVRLVVVGALSDCAMRTCAGSAVGVPSVTVAQPVTPTKAPTNPKASPATVNRRMGPTL